MSNNNSQSSIIYKYKAKLEGIQSKLDALKLKKELAAIKCLCFEDMSLNALIGIPWKWKKLNVNYGYCHLLLKYSTLLFKLVSRVQYVHVIVLSNHSTRPNAIVISIKKRMLCNIDSSRCMRI